MASAVLRIKNSQTGNSFIDIANPSKMQWDIYDIDSDDTGRTITDVNLYRQRLGTKRKLTCEWHTMLWDEMSTLLNAVTDTFFQLEYPDAMTGTRRIMTCYVGDRSAPVYYYDLENNEVRWENLTFNFIER